MIIQERAIIQVFWSKQAKNAKFQDPEGLRFSLKIPPTMLFQVVIFFIFFISD
ncbi:MAG: hypothetical protein ACKO4W_14200 [Bacteroidota bacterium]